MSPSAAGDAPPRSLQAVRLAVRELRARLSWDAFACRFLLDGSAEGVESRVMDELYRRAPGVSWTYDLVGQGLEYALDLGEVRRVDPLREALAAIPEWSAEIDIWAEAAADGLELEPDYDPALAAAIIRTAMVGAVLRILEPGAKMDVMPVLIGPQGIGKSMLVRSLALRDEWFTDAVSLHRLADRDELMRLEAAHVVEFAELAGLRRAELDFVKKWLAQQRDTYRRPYARQVVQLPRRFVVFGTTNDDSFLSDTENRRFLPIRIRRVRLEWWRAHRDDLYAAARALVEAGARPVLGGSCGPLLAAEHERAIERDPWEQTIIEIAMGCDEFGTRDVLARLDRPIGQATPWDEARIGRLVRRCLPGWRKVKKRTEDGRRWVWRRGP